MRILMLATRYVSEDGWCLREFCEGQYYEVGELLAVQLLRLGYARLENH